MPHLQGSWRSCLLHARCCRSSWSQGRLAVPRQEQAKQEEPASPRARAASGAIIVARKKCTLAGKALQWRGLEQPAWLAAGWLLSHTLPKWAAMSTAACLPLMAPLSAMSKPRATMSCAPPPPPAWSTSCPPPPHWQKSGEGRGLALQLQEQATLAWQAQAACKPFRSHLSFLQGALAKLGRAGLLASSGKSPHPACLAVASPSQPSCLPAAPLWWPFAWTGSGPGPGSMAGCAVGSPPSPPAPEGLAPLPAQGVQVQIGCRHGSKESVER